MFRIVFQIELKFEKKKCFCGGGGGGQKLVLRQENLSKQRREPASG